MSKEKIIETLKVYLIPILIGLFVGVLVVGAQAVGTIQYDSGTFKIHSTDSLNVGGSLTVGATLTVSGASITASSAAVTASSFSGSGANLTALNASQITSGQIPSADRIPSLDASKITGTFDAARIPSLDTSKITTGTFAAAQIPSLDAGKITTGTFTAVQIPSLDASKITGIFDINRIPHICVKKKYTQANADPECPSGYFVAGVTDDSGNAVNEGGPPYSGYLFCCRTEW